jgi:hypothetical protein
LIKNLFPSIVGAHRFPVFHHILFLTKWKHRSTPYTEAQKKDEPHPLCNLLSQQAKHLNLQQVGKHKRADRLKQFFPFAQSE